MRIPPHVVHGKRFSRTALEVCLRVVAFLLLAVFSPGAANAQIARTGSVSASATSGTFSATATNDLKIVFAFRSGSTTAPALPSGWTSIATGATSSGGTPGSFRIGCNVSANSSATGTGTWTNATAIAGVSYSGTVAQSTASCNTTGIGAIATSNAKTSATASYPGITLTISGSNSWVAGFLGDSAGSTCSPSGMTSVSATGDGRVSDTNATASSWSTTTCSVTSGTWVSYVVEILNTVKEAPSESNTTSSSVVALRNALAGNSETLTTSVSCIVCKNAQNLQEGNVTGDGLTGIRGGNGAISETISETDSVTAMSSGASRSAALTETSSESDAAVGSAGRRAAITESLTASISVSATAGRFSPVAETVSESDSVTGLKLHTVSVAETLSPSQSLGGFAGRFAGPAITLSESDSVAGVHSAVAAESESLTTTGSVAVFAGRGGLISESVSESDSIAALRSMHAAISESLTTTASDSTTRSMHKAESETLGESDSVSANQTAHQENMTESLALMDTVVNSRSLDEAMSDTESEADSVAAHKSANYPTSITENLATVVGLVKAAGNHASPTEILSESDSCTASQCHPVGMVDGHVTVDSVKIIKSQVSLSETLSPSQAVTASRGGSSSVTMTETLNSCGGFGAVGYGGSQYGDPCVSDSIAESKCFACSSMTEGYVTVDSLTAVKASANASLSESLTVSDHIGVVQCISFPAEILMESDSVSVLPSHVANITDTLFAITDTVAEAVPHRLILITETQTTTGIISVVGNHSAHPTETLSHSDSLPTPHAAHVANITESIAESDSLTGTSTPQKSSSLVDSLVFTDSIRAISLHGASTSDFLTEGDSVSAHSSQHVALAESLTLSDLVGWQTGKRITEVLAHSDSVVVNSSHGAVLSESVSESDSIASSTTIQQVANMVENAGVSDSIATGTVLHRNAFLSDAVSSNDVLTVTTSHLNLQRSMTESAVHSDSIALQSGRAMFEFVIESDQVRAVAAHAASPSESLAPFDFLTVSKTPQEFATMSESLSISDSILPYAFLNPNPAESLTTIDMVQVRGNTQQIVGIAEFLTESDSARGRNPHTQGKRFILVESP